jgi:glycosyltransferase involved in cell wall biosynthesis
VAERVNVFYGLKSVVINPFVDLKDFRPLQNTTIEKKNYYLMVTALAPNKRVDLAIAAFKKLGWVLKIVGGGQDEAQLLESQSSNIQFLGSLSREEILKLMSEAKGFVFPGTEDFGITPLESMAAGTPVIAFKGGGVIETLNDKTAKFFLKQEVDQLVQALKEYDVKNYSRQDLFFRAEAFSKERFQSEFSNFIKRVKK